MTFGDAQARGHQFGFRPAQPMSQGLGMYLVSNGIQKLLTLWFVDRSNRAPAIPAAPTMQLDPSLDEPEGNSSDSESRNNSQESEEEGGNDTEDEDGDLTHSVQGIYHIFPLPS